MKWRDVRPGRAFVSEEGSTFFLLGVWYASELAYLGGRRMKLLYLITRGNTVSFWEDTRCDSYDVVESRTYSLMSEPQATSQDLSSGGCTA